jgi:colanic acid/amylovoran biosynthesis glycosyltransferase
MKSVEKTPICIVIPAEVGYSETFIKNHIDELSFKKTVVQGSSFEWFACGSRYLFPQLWYNRLLQQYCSKWLRLHKDYFASRKFKQFLISNKIEAVLAEYGPTGALICDVCYEAGIPLIVHFHGYDASVTSILEQYREKYARMFERAAAIIAVSTDMVTRLLKLGAPESKIRLNPYGINLSLFESTDVARGNHFISVGRFVEKKAPHLTLLAFHQAWVRNPDIKLKMVGDGPLLDICRQMVKAMKMDQAVEFLGVRTPNEIAALMSTSLAFLQHSIIAGDGNAEGLPLAILEAGSCSLPVISTRHEGIKDVIREGRTGILVDECDCNAMTVAIDVLASDHATAREMGRNARAVIELDYTLDRHIGELEATIRDAARSNHGGN